MGQKGKTDKNVKTKQIGGLDGGGIANCDRIGALIHP